MACISNEARRAADKVMLTTLRARAGADGSLQIHKGELMQATGMSYSSVNTSMERLKNRGLIEVEPLSENRLDGLFICVDMGEAVKQEAAKVVVPIVTAPKRLRVCPKCGTEASNEQAGFCWRCGSTLKTDDEILREKFQGIVSKLPHMYGSAKADELDSDMKVLWAIYKKAFKNGGH